LKVLIAAVSSRSASDSYDSLTSLYVKRTAAYATVESQVFRTEEALLGHVERMRARTSRMLVLLDSRGKMMSSEELAAWVGGQRDSGQQQVIFAIGPADGWSEAARRQAGLMLSFGPMTLPHELARVVLAEQVYRAFTILAGHPYHGGH
jgi:23S rRNA (pseudouridine1915-N3)-methyltransferase